MSNTIFLTGDESYPPSVARAVAASTLTQLALKAVEDGADQPIHFYTGDCRGFEQGVREVCNALGVALEGVVATRLDADGNSDWDERHGLVSVIADNVLVVHNEPLSSAMVESAMRILAGKLTVVSAV